jgi:hypothetical protein
MSGGNIVVIWEREFQGHGDELCEKCIAGNGEETKDDGECTGCVHAT